MFYVNEPRVGVRETCNDESWVRERITLLALKMEEGDHEARNTGSLWKLKRASNRFALEAF